MLIVNKKELTTKYLISKLRTFSRVKTRQKTVFIDVGTVFEPKEKRYIDEALRQGFVIQTEIPN